MASPDSARANSPPADASPAGASPWLRPDATALAISIAVVVAHVSVFPSMPVRPWAAVLNEWLVWFAGLYVLLTALTALSQRVFRAGGVPGTDSRAGLDRRVR